MMIANADLAEFLNAAASSGCPKDQTTGFTKAGYVPLPGFLPFHAAARAADRVNGPEWLALGGKRGPGKSHAAMAQAALDDCQRISGLKFLFLRKVMKTAAESLEDLVRRLCINVAHKQTANQVEFANGSRILLGGYMNARDIDKYLGIEYDGILIEECTQLTEIKKDAIRGSLRSSKDVWRPRIYLTTNADGPGLLWFKRMFVAPFRAGNESTTRFFDVSRVENPFTDAGYAIWLNSLTGPLRKAWRDGDWDAFAGMSFPEWNHDRHIIRPFDIPDSWPKWRAVDEGTAAPFCAGWLTKNMDTKRIYIYREHYQAGLASKQQAEAIKIGTPPAEEQVIKLTYADPSMFATEKQNKDGKFFSTADEYQKNGVILTRADNNRLAGIRKVHNVLADLADGEPGLQVFENCPHLIEQMESLAADKSNPEDVDTDQEDHAYDMLRYGLTNERAITEPRPKIMQNNIRPVQAYKYF